MVGSQDACDWRNFGPLTHLLTLSTCMAAMRIYACLLGQTYAGPLTWAAGTWTGDRLVRGAGAEAERAAEVSGAWLVLAQVAALDPSAPSWEFLQVAFESTPAA